MIALNYLLQPKHYLDVLRVGCFFLDQGVGVVVQATTYFAKNLPPLNIFFLQSPSLFCRKFASS